MSTLDTIVKDYDKNIVLRDCQRQAFEYLHDKKGEFSIQSCRSCYARLYLCQRPFYKILVKVRNSKTNAHKIILIIVNINKDENKSLISNQFSFKNDSPPHFLENYFAEVKIKDKSVHKLFLRENIFEMSYLFSSLLIFTILSTFFYCF
jgi:hypothetical protein